MTYSNDLKKKIIDNIRSKKYTDIEMINFFNISRGTFYKIKKNMDKEIIYRNKRTSKITTTIMTYIKKYVTRNINFNYTKLVQLINKNFNVLVSKTTIYDVLAKKNITKKKNSEEANFHRKNKTSITNQKISKNYYRHTR